jgi:hypothetical protein
MIVNFLLINFANRITVFEIFANAINSILIIPEYNGLSNFGFLKRRNSSRTFLLAVRILRIMREMEV